MKIEVLGSGCRNCLRAAERIESTLRVMQVEAHVEKVSDPGVMLAHRVMRTPAVVIDGKLVHSGSVPDESTIRHWFQS